MRPWPHRQGSDGLKVARGWRRPHPFRSPMTMPPTSPHRQSLAHPPCQIGVAFYWLKFLWTIFFQKHKVFENFKFSPQICKIDFLTSFKNSLFWTFVCLWCWCRWRNIPRCRLEHMEQWVLVFNEQRQIVALIEKALVWRRHRPRQRLKSFARSRPPPKSSPNHTLGIDHL